MNRTTPRALSTSTLARVALFSALTIIFLLLVRLSPAGDLLFFALTSLCVAYVFVIGGRKEALLCYLVSSLISILLPGWWFSWPYYLFFGLYPLVKSLIECYARDRQQHARAVNFLLKALFALGIGLVSFQIIRLFVPALFASLAARLPWALPGVGLLGLWLLAVLIAFFIYDYALSVLIDRMVRYQPRR